MKGIITPHMQKVQIILFLASINCFQGCTVKWGCEEKSLPKAENVAVQELLSLNGLDSIRPNRIASQHDVDGCETGHILQVTASEMGLDTIPPSISSFSKLQTLLIDNNNLKSLPIEIVNLNPIHLGLRGNKICNPPELIDEWALKWDSTWKESQRCP